MTGALITSNMALTTIYILNMDYTEVFTPVDIHSCVALYVHTELKQNYHRFSGELAFGG